MNITTAFKVNDLVAYKYGHSTDEMKSIAEVIEVQTVTCSAGTQVFYHCRRIFLRRDFFKNEQEKWVVSYGIAGERRDIPYDRYREDELIECPDDVKELLEATNNHEA